jgi:diguanylate cyclase (GGDEF)-like protein
MRDGTSLQVLKSAVPINIEGETMMLEGIIDLRKQKDLELLAYSDPLTGILNRKGMRDKFKHIQDQTSAGNQNYTVMMFDLDDFKRINDNYGHFAGDNVLRFFVQCVKNELQIEDIFCRWGGDEFLVITEMNIQDCLPIVQRIIENAKVAPYKNEAWGDISLRISVGIADIERCMTLDQTVHKADVYMYHAKRSHIGIYYEKQCEDDVN